MSITYGESNHLTVIAPPNKPAACRFTTRMISTTSGQTQKAPPAEASGAEIRERAWTAPPCRFERGPESPLREIIGARKRQNRNGMEPEGFRVDQPPAQWNTKCDLPRPGNRRVLLGC